MIEEIKKSFYDSIGSIPEQEESNIARVENTTNVVSGAKLRQIQSETLSQVKDYLANTFGPMGSNTKIIKGNTKESITSSYSKDGLKVLQNIINSGPIEASIIEELIEITRHVEGEVGDGTTSTVILSSLIFDKLMLIQNKYNIPPYQLISKFEAIVDKIKASILEIKKECTLEDIFDICMISTNSNKGVSHEILNIYDQFGIDVDLSVGVSNNANTYTKEYDGLTITEGFADPVYINNRDSMSSEIHNAKVYYFEDPIDTMDMVSFFEKIVNNNIYEPLMNDEAPIPTVVTCPRISNDMSALLKRLTQTLYQFDVQSANKPPILVITNVIASDEAIMNDIANLCGCKAIKKYIDPKIQKKDQEAGLAPTIDNVQDFFGECELVVSDAKKTKFINPAHMHIYKEDGSVEDDPIYTSMVNFLQEEILHAEQNGGTATEIGMFKKRLSALKANMVEFLVGGVTISERDAKKDLIEDAIKNCRSAARSGVGFASNYEGLYAINKIREEASDDIDDLDIDLINALYVSYIEIQEILYGTVSTDKEDIDNHIEESITKHYGPYNISDGFLPELDNFGANVKCSIMLDINILDTLSKIISLMVTCNQCLLQASNINRY